MKISDLPIERQCAIFAACDQAEREKREAAEKAKQDEKPASTLNRLTRKLKGKNHAFERT